MEKQLLIDVKGDKLTISPFYFYTRGDIRKMTTYDYELKKGDTVASLNSNLTKDGFAALEKRIGVKKVSTLEKADVILCGSKLKTISCGYVTPSSEKFRLFLQQNNLSVLLNSDVTTSKIFMTTRRGHLTWEEYKNKVEIIADIRGLSEREFHRKINRSDYIVLKNNIDDKILIPDTNLISLSSNRHGLVLTEESFRGLAQMIKSEDSETFELGLTTMFSVDYVESSVYLLALFKTYNNRLSRYVHLKAFKQILLHFNINPKFFWNLGMSEILTAMRYTDKYTPEEINKLSRLEKIIYQVESNMEEISSSFINDSEEIQL